MPDLYCISILHNIMNNSNVQKTQLQIETMTMTRKRLLLLVMHQHSNSLYESKITVKKPTVQTAHICMPRLWQGDEHVQRL